jgi:hypothetical protein
MIDFIKVGEKSLPVKWNTRAKIHWEKEAGVLLADLVPKITGYDKEGNAIIKQGVAISVHMGMLMCFEAIKEGHRIEGKKFDLGIFDIYDMQDEYDLESLIAPVIFPSDDAKK